MFKKNILKVAEKQQITRKKIYIKSKLLIQKLGQMNINTFRVSELNTKIKH